MAHTRLFDGDSLGCPKCGPLSQVTNLWLDRVSRRYFPTRAARSVYESDLARIKCAKCGAEGMIVFPKTSISKSNQKWDVCRFCNGFGGLNEFCSNCGGTGWENKSI